MPTYEYRCEHGHEFEMEQRITDEPLLHCTFVLARLVADGAAHVTIVCGELVKRLIPRGTTFVLKGTGWTPRG